MPSRFFVPNVSIDVVANYEIVNIAIDDLANFQRSDDISVKGGGGGGGVI